MERYATRLAAPKAHALNPRSLEICRQFGLDVNEIRNVGTRRRDAFWVNFITCLAGEHVGRLPYERMDPEVLNDTPTVCLPARTQYSQQFLSKSKELGLIHSH